jgi:hypothetical protein
MRERKSDHRLNIKRKKISGLSPRAKYTARPPIFGEVGTNFLGLEGAMLST